MDLTVRAGGPVRLIRRWPLLRYLVSYVAAALFLEACETRSAREDQLRDGGGLDGGVLAPDLDAQSDADDPADGSGSDVTSCPARPVEQIPAGGSCDAAITQCGLPGNILADCLGGALRSVLSSRITECGLYCGDLDVGFDAGCATSVRWNVAGSFSDTTTTTAKLCLEKTLFTSRFDCTPGEGWQRLYLGSCTVP